jgi:hypothetical protein
LLAATAHIFARLIISKMRTGNDDASPRFGAGSVTGSVADLIREQHRWPFALYRFGVNGSLATFSADYCFGLP